MGRYEVITPVSNGRKAPHKVGSILELEAEEAEGLVKLGALRAVPEGKNAVDESGDPAGEKPAKDAGKPAADAATAKPEASGAPKPKPAAKRARKKKPAREEPS